MSSFVPAERFVISSVGPAVLVPGRVAHLLDRELEPMRRRYRELDQEAAAVLMALHTTAMLWRAEREPVTVCGPEERPFADTGAEFTCEQAADQLSLDQRSVRRAGAAGELIGRKIAGRWFFTAAAVDEYRERRHARRA